MSGTSEIQLQAPSKDADGAGSKDHEIVFADFAKIMMTVGQIKHCQRVENSEKLLKLTVDFGPLGERCIISGIAKSYTPEELLDRKSVFVTNLQPRKMAGEVSEGMMLCAGDDRGGCTIVAVGPRAENGTRVC